MYIYFTLIEKSSYQSEARSQRASAALVLEGAWPVLGGRVQEEGRCTVHRQTNIETHSVNAA